MTRRRSASFIALLAMLVAVLVPVTAFADQQNDPPPDSPEEAEASGETAEPAPAEETAEPEPAEETPEAESVDTVEDTEEAQSQTTDDEQPEIGDDADETEAPDGQQAEQTMVAEVEGLDDSEGTDEVSESGLSATTSISRTFGKDWYFADSTEDPPPIIDDAELLSELSALFEVELWLADPNSALYGDGTLVTSTTVPTFGATPTEVTFPDTDSTASYVIYAREISASMGDSDCTHTSPRLPYIDNFGWRSLSESSVTLFANDIDCRQQVGFELTKIWLDEHGQQVDDLVGDLDGDRNWSLTAAAPDDTGADSLGDQIARLEWPYPSTFTATATVSSGTEYTVVEQGLPRGWRVLPAGECEDRWEDNSGNAGVLQLRTEPNFGTDGSWMIDGYTNHVVCNQRLPEITVVKDWIGDPAGFGTATFDIRFWGDPSEDSSSQALELDFDDAPYAGSLIDTELGVISGDSVPIPIDLDVDRVTIHENVDGASCDWRPIGTVDTFDDTSDDDSPFQSLQASTTPEGDWSEPLANWNRESFTVTFINEADCPPPPTTSVPSSASVTVDKVWEVNGEVVDAPAEATPSFEVSLTNSLGIPVGGSPRTVDDGGTASFPGLTSGSIYDVSVAEDPDSLPGASVFAADGETCEFAGSTVELSDATVTAPGSVDATVTNAYQCEPTTVLEEIEASVDVDVAKTWQTTDGTVIEIPATVTAAFTIELFAAGSDDAIATVADVAAATTTSFDDLVDGDEYTLAWSETAAPDTLELGDETCTLVPDQSATAGEQTFTAGDADALSVSFEAVNVYDCEGSEVLEEIEERPDATEVADVDELSHTGSDSGTLLTIGLLLSMIGLAILRLGRRREQTIDS